MMSQLVRVLLVTSFTLGIVTLPSAWADDPKPPEQPQPRPPGGGGDPRRQQQQPNMERDMKALDRAFKQVKEQVSDPTKNRGTLDLVLQMERATASARSQIPPQIQKMPEADRGKQLTEFRKMMRNLLQQEMDLEDQLTADDNKKAAETVATMQEMREQGHKDLGVKDHDR